MNKIFYKVFTDMFTLPQAQLWLFFEIGRGFALRKSKMLSFNRRVAKIISILQIFNYRELETDTSHGHISSVMNWKKKPNSIISTT